MAVIHGPRIPEKTDLVYTVAPQLKSTYYLQNCTNNYGLSPTGKKFYTGISDDYLTESTNPSFSQNRVNNGNDICLSALTCLTIYQWVKIEKFQYKRITWGGSDGSPIHQKACLISTFRSGPIESVSNISIGARAPYYFEPPNVTDYRLVFEPFLFTFSIQRQARTLSFSTDYKFYFNNWYLLAFEINNLNMYNKNIKVYINDNIENTTVNTGPLYRYNHKTNGMSVLHNRVQNDNVITHPPFRTLNNNIASNSSSQNAPITFLVPDAGSDRSILNQIILNPNCQWFKSKTAQNSYIEFGPLFMFNNIYDNKIYNSYKGVYIPS